MIALDTNVVLRVILGDDRRQEAAALALLDQRCFIPIGVLIETGWVLTHAYGLNRQSLAEAVAGLLAHPNVLVADADGVSWAVSRFAATKCDWADLLHIVSSTGAERFATFDRLLPKQAGDASPVPVAVVEA